MESVEGRRRSAAVAMRKGTEFVYIQFSLGPQTPRLEQCLRVKRVKGREGKGIDVPAPQASYRYMHTPVGYLPPCLLLCLPLPYLR